MNDSTETGLVTAAWLFPYFLLRQANKLDYQPVNPIKKKKKKSMELCLDLVSLSSTKGARN